MRPCSQLQASLIKHAPTYFCPTVGDEEGKSLKRRRRQTTERLVERILARRLDFEERNKQKEKKELAAFEALTKSQQLEVENGSTE
jgi:hypothetical protein